MRRVRGFTMVELLVAVTLSILVMGGLMSVFLGAKTSFQSTSGVGNLTEGGRFAIDFLTRAVRGAGTMGCASSNVTDVSNLNGGTTLPLNFSQPLWAYEATGTAPANTIVLPAVPVTAGAWLPALDPLLSALPNPPVAGSDVLVVRTTMQQSAGIYVTAIAPGTTTFSVASTAPTITGPGSLLANNLALITDCTQATVFEMTGVAGTTITHSAGGGLPGNLTGPFAGTYGAGSMVYVPDTIVYYIGIGADGDGALFSVDLNGTGVFQTPQELVPDVENMQVLFGVDTVGNNAVTQYFKAQTVPPSPATTPNSDYNSVVSVKVALLAASPANALPPPAPTVPVTYNLLGTLVQAPLDRRARKVFEATIAVRSKAT